MYAHPWMRIEHYDFTFDWRGKQEPATLVIMNGGGTYAVMTFSGENLYLYTGMSTQGGYHGAVVVKNQVDCELKQQVLESRERGSGFGEHEDAWYALMPPACANKVREMLKQRGDGA